MKCIHEKCPEYYFSDHRATCIANIAHIAPNGDCDIEKIIKQREFKLNELINLKNDISDENYQMILQNDITTGV